MRNFSRSRQILGLALLAISLTLAVSCIAPKHITNLPPGVSEQEVKDWYQATGALDDIAKLTKSATDSAITLHNNKLWPGDENQYQKTLAIFARIDQGGIHIGNVLKAAPRNFSTPVKAQIAGEVQAISDELLKAQADSTLSTSNTFKTILASLQIAITALKLASQF